MLFQRGIGPSHILLLQEIRAHNSPEPWCTAPSTPPGTSPLLMERVRGQATGNKKSLFPESRALLVNHLIPMANAAAKHCAAPRAYINHLMSSYAPLQIFSFSMFYPQPFAKPYPSYFLALQSTFGSTHIPNLTPSYGHHLGCDPPKEVRRQGAIHLHETWSHHSPHQLRSSSAAACERAGGVRQ